MVKIQEVDILKFRRKKKVEMLLKTQIYLCLKLKAPGNFLTVIYHSFNQEGEG